MTLLLSALAGVVLGVVGGGGGVLLMPILHFVLHLGGHESIAISRAAVLATSLTGVVMHARRGGVVWRAGLVLSAAGMPAAFVMSKWVAPLIPAAWLTVAFGVLMITVAALLLRPQQAQEEVQRTPAPLWQFVAQGVVAGAINGLLGAGGGFVIVPTLLLFGGLTMQTAVGTSLFVIAMNIIAGLFGSSAVLAQTWNIVLPVAAACMLGALVGLFAFKSTKPATLRRWFAQFVLVVGAVLLVSEIPALLRG